MSAVSSSRHRVQQGLTALRPRVPTDRDTILAEWLTSAQATAFRQLPSHDQAHLLRVQQALVSRGVTNPDLLIAGLLHDIGKGSEHGHVRLVDRAAKVLLARIAPGLLTWLVRSPASWWRHGLCLAVHHPKFGAEQAAALGCSPRTCWLIAHHEDVLPDHDPDLALLIEVDRQTP